MAGTSTKLAIMMTIVIAILCYNVDVCNTGHYIKSHKISIEDFVYVLLRFGSEPHRLL